MAPVGNWAACVRIVEPITKETLDIFELENNEHAVSIALTNFTGSDETFLMVGSVKDYRIGETKSFTDAFITTFVLG
jgi:splicing factor 3B subunit 3